MKSPVHATSIPRTYAMFSALFSQMDAPLSNALGGILQAFASALDVPEQNESQTNGTFIGYDGLENRGRLSNLLETEWLLRELDPDDFVRRIAEGEVLFRRRAFENVGKNSSLAVVLDCGPWMLGRNRLVGLAALFHLALRAERRGAQLRWIVPSDSGDPVWLDALTRETLRHFLGNVVQGSLSSEHISRALGALATEGRCECWYVGAQQTGVIADHPDIAASFLVRTRYCPDAAGEAEITVNRRTRKLAKIDVTFPDEATCIAALRRPFKPEIRPKPGRRENLTSTTNLSTLPFETVWRLDRHNQAVLIRWPEGLLWQPLLANEQVRGIWIPLPDKRPLLGLRTERRRVLTLLTGGRAEDAGQRIQPVILHEITLQSAGSPAQEIIGRGEIPFDRRQFPDTALGGLQMTTEGSVIQRNGTRLIFSRTVDGTLTIEAPARNQVLFSDASYRTELLAGQTSALRVVNISRTTPIVPNQPIPGIENVASDPRHILFSPSSKLLAVSVDGQHYSVFGSAQQSELDVPEGLTLLNMTKPDQAIAWDAQTTELVRLINRAGRIEHDTWIRHRGGPLDHVRYCPLTGTVFGMQVDDAGYPSRFFPVHTKGGWRDSATINVVDAIENARTVWLQD